MITRIVKLTIAPSEKDSFVAAFVDNKENIRSFPGCEGLTLLQDKRFDNVYFTYSHWKSEESIDDYRKSDLFKGIWANVKPKFCAAPEAWSVDELFKL